MAVLRLLLNQFKLDFVNFANISSYGCLFCCLYINMDLQVSRFVKAMVQYKLSWIFSFGWYSFSCVRFSHWVFPNRRF